MCTADGVPGDAGSGSTGFSSTAEAPRAGAALAGYPNSAAGTGLEPAAPGAAPASTGEIQPRLAARAGLPRRPGARDADGHASTCARLAALGQGGPA
jgi:hypothetical protein